MKQRSSPNRVRVGGFSLVELLVVVAIIAIMAAVALPQVMTYLRNYQIRGATQQVASEIQVARSKAISKNVNLGAVFTTRDTTTYQHVIEDDLEPQTAPNWMDIAGENFTTLAASSEQAGHVRSLPSGIEFAAVAACPGRVAGPTSWGFRFNRLGMGCSVGATAACAAPGGAPAYSQFLTSDGAGGLTICLRQTQTGLTRWVSVASGGRIQVQP